jgi:hypothetical protein
LSAFEREYPDPVHRMRALGWRAAEDAGGELARQRLMALRVDAEKASGRTLSWEKSEMRAQPRKTWGDWVFDVVVIVVFGLLLLGGSPSSSKGFKSFCAGSVTKPGCQRQTLLCALPRLCPLALFAACCPPASGRPHPCAGDLSRTYARSVRTGGEHRWRTL